MTIILFIFLVLIAFIVCQIVVIFLNYRESKFYREIRYRNITQDGFGRIRHKLVQSLCEGDLDINSKTFVFFNSTSTKVMRYPDKYKELSKILRDSFWDEKNGSESETSKAIKIEAKKHPKLTKEILDEMDDALTNLMLYHSSTLQSLFLISQGLLKVFQIFAIKFSLDIVTPAENFLSKRDENMKMVLQTKKSVRLLALATT